MHLKDLQANLSELAEPCSRNLGLYQSLDSTNALAKRIARHYLSVGVPVPEFQILALEQTAGRGRLGNIWSSPRGGLYLSLVASLAAADLLDSLPIRVAVELCRAVDEWVDSGCLIKWPNDLMVAGQKVGGVLLEAVGHGDRVAVAIGVGLNHSPEDALLPDGATTMARQSSRLAPLSTVAHRLMTALEKSLEASEPRHRLAEEYTRRSIHRVGQALRCRTPQDEIEGIFCGFDERGFLRLRTSSGDRRLAAGEIIEKETARHEER